MSIFELMNEKQSQKVQPSREKMKKLDKALDAIKKKIWRRCRVKGKSFE